MKIRQLVSAAVLTLALSCSAFAGDIWIPGLTNPPPPGGGRVANSASQVENTALGTLTETATVICLRMLSLF